jgi:hypothetical protein
MKIFIGATYSDISSYMKMKWGKNNFFSSRFFPCTTLHLYVCAKRIRHDKTVFFATQQRRNEKGRKRFKFFCGAFNLLFCDVAHFRFSSFRNLLCRFISVVLLILHTHTKSGNTCRGIIWIDRKIWQILVPLCRPRRCLFLSLMSIITFTLSGKSDWIIVMWSAVWYWERGDAVLRILNEL